jgi:iron complex outermembrane receptor protein
MEQYGRPAFGVIKDPRLPLGGYRGVYDAAYTANFVNPFDGPLANDQQGSEGRLFDGATLRIETPLAGMTFNSTTAYRRFNTHNLTDNDGGAAPPAPDHAGRQARAQLPAGVQTVRQNR